MNPLGGLMKVLLGGLLAWAFVSGALSRFIDKTTAAVAGQASGPSPATPPASTNGATA